MKITKKGKMLGAILAIAFVVYNIIFFVLCGFADHTPVFWMSWVFMNLAFIAMACIGLLLGKKGMFLRDWLFGYPLIRHTTLYLIFEFIGSTVFVIFEKQIGWGWAFCVQLLILAVYLVFAISCFMAKDTISEVHTKVSDKTRFIKLLRVDVEMLVKKCADAETREQCRQLAETIRFSDPMSDEALFELEKELAFAVSQCERTIDLEDYETAQGWCAKAFILLEERNEKCKALK